jgi:hypothetical protein
MGGTMIGMFRRFADWFQRRREQQGAAAVVVRFDEQRITATYRSGDTESIDWTEVQCIAIETNDSGPWGDDVWWVLEGDAEKRCAYPQGADGETEALAEYPQRFAGFSHEAVIAAMGSTSNARFVCWSRTPPD